MNRSALCASAAIMALLWPTLSTPAFAQAAAPPGAPARNAEIEEVVVTARRVAENIQDVPVAVNVLGREKLQTLVLNTPLDISRLSASVSNGTCGGSRASCIPVIRGQSNAFASGKPSVVSYFAEVPFFPTSYLDLANVQVVAGPQGTLFGETATGGVIIYTPQKPTADFNGYLDAQGGGYSYHQLEGAIGGPIIGDKLMFRVSGQYRKRKGYMTGISSYGAPPIDFENEDRRQLRVQLTARPTEHLENYSLFSYTDNRSNGYGSLITSADPRFMNPGVVNLVPAAVPSQVAQWIIATGRAPPPGLTYGQIIQEALGRQNAAGKYTIFYNYDRHRQTQDYGFLNTTTWDAIPGLTLKNIFSLIWNKAKGPTIDVDGTDYPIVDTRGSVVPGTTNMYNPQWAWVGGWPNRTWTDEIQVIGKLFDNRLNWQAGYYYRYSAVRDWQGGQGTVATFSGPSGDPGSAAFCTSLGLTTAVLTAAGQAPPPQGGTPTCTQLSVSKSISYAGYGQGTFAVTDKLRLTAGFRRTWDERSNTNSGGPTARAILNGIGVAIPVVGRQPLPGSGTVTTLVPLTHADTYTLTADYRPNDDVMLYVTRRTGYKGGGINSNALPGDANRVFGPEKILNHELGAKTTFEAWGVQGRANIALYQDDYKGVQRSTTVPGSAITVTTNLADIKNKGVEFETSLRLTNWFRLEANYAYINTKYRSYLETALCSAQYWRPQCHVGGNPSAAIITVPGSNPAVAIPVVIDHAHGTVTVNGQTFTFKPEKPADAHPVKWAVQPAILLKSFIGEDVTLSANIQYTGNWELNQPARSIFAGVPPLSQQSVVGIYDDVLSQTNDNNHGYSIDLRADWRHVRGSRLSLAATVTNLTNVYWNTSRPVAAFTIGGTGNFVPTEPRMWFVEAKYEFGG